MAAPVPAHARLRLYRMNPRRDSAAIRKRSFRAIRGGTTRGGRASLPPPFSASSSASLRLSGCISSPFPLANPDRNSFDFPEQNANIPTGAPNENSPIRPRAKPQISNLKPQMSKQGQIRVKKGPVGTRLGRGWDVVFPSIPNRKTSPTLETMRTYTKIQPRPSPPTIFSRAPAPPAPPGNNSTSPGGAHRRPASPAPASAPADSTSAMQPSAHPPAPARSEAAAR